MQRVCLRSSVLTAVQGREILPATRTFSCENTQGYIEPGRTQPKKMRPFTITGLGLPVNPKNLTAAGKPAVSLSVLRELAGSQLDSESPNYGPAYSFFGEGEEGHRACRAIDALCRVSAIDTLLGSFIRPLQVRWLCCHHVACECSAAGKRGRTRANPLFVELEHRNRSAVCPKPEPPEPARLGKGYLQDQSGFCSPAAKGSLNACVNNG